TLAPKDALIAHGHARAALEAGIPAVYWFERAHHLAPLDGAGLLALAAANSAQGAHEAALVLLDAHLRQHPAWIPGHALTARLRCVLGDKARFVESFERALAAVPTEAELSIELIMTLIHAGQYDETLEV